MLYYILLFSLTTFLGLKINECKSIGNEKRITVLYSFILCLFVLFVGCRSVNVGSDTLNYQNKFDYADGISLAEYIFFADSTDTGFYVFTWLVRKITSSVNVYFILISFIYFFVFLKFIRRFSKDDCLSIWLLSSLGYTTFALSTLRQSIAIALCLWAYMLSIDRKYLKCIFPMLFAVSFHNTSIVFLPMLFVRLVIENKKPWRIFFIMCTIIALAPKIMFFLMTNVEDGAYEETQVGGVGMIVFISFLILIGIPILFKKKNECMEHVYYEYVAICLALCIFISTRFNLAAMRLFLYYMAFSVVYIPNIIKQYKPDISRWLTCLIICVSLFYLVNKVMSTPYENSRLLLPYSFFWYD